MKIFLHRRGFIARVAALMVLPFVAQRRAFAQSEAVDSLIEKITGGAPLQRGRVKLEIPTLADNGNSVSLRVVVDSPMTP